MIHTQEIILIIIFLIIIYYFTNSSQIYESFTTNIVKSTVDYNEYPVVAKYEDGAIAANLIGSINIFTRNFIKSLHDTYTNPNNVYHPDYQKGREISVILMDRYNSKSLRENEPESPNKTSYTTNKGEVISLCLREKVTGKNEFHDLDTLKFVTLHELAHVVTPELDHSILFWTNFKFILEYCRKYNLYVSQDYKIDVVNYCGMPITYNPMLDTDLQSYFS
jgi:hypothetical protein